VPEDPAPVSNNVPESRRWTRTHPVTGFPRDGSTRYSGRAPGFIPPGTQNRTTESRAMSHSKDKDTKKMVKKEPLKSPKEKKEAKRLKKLERQRG